MQSEGKSPGFNNVSNSQAGWETKNKDPNCSVPKKSGNIRNGPENECNHVISLYIIYRFI